MGARALLPEREIRKTLPLEKTMFDRTCPRMTTGEVLFPVINSALQKNPQLQYRHINWTRVRNARECKFN